MEQSPNCPNCGSNLIICSCTRQEREMAQRLKDSAEELKNNLTALKQVPPRDSDARELLEIASKNQEIDGVIILALMKDGTQRLWTNSMSHQEKSFLKCFFDAWIFQWFDGSYNLDHKK